MSPLVTLLWVALVVLMWVGVVAGVWAIVSSREEHPPEVSQSPTKE